MEAWLPLFDIFMNSPTPETDASNWLKQSFIASYASSSVTTAPITTASFLSLLVKPFDAITNPPSSTHSTKRVMFIQTLPDIVQSQILSFLTFEHQRFCARDLIRLARDMLGEEGRVDFWVKKVARNLLDAVSERGFEWISSLSLDSGGEGLNEEFESLPGWLKDAACDNEMVLPWLPVSLDELNSITSVGPCVTNQQLWTQVGENGEGDFEEPVERIEIEPATNVEITSEIQTIAASLRNQVMNFESSYKTVRLANEMRQLCLEKGANPIGVLGVIEPWTADDETTSVLMSHLLDGTEEELGWPSLVLCSLVLPKLLVLEEPASRILVTATIEYCKLHQRAAVYALIFPLIMRKEGINNPISDLITKIVRDCLHPAQVAAFIQKLLCGPESERRFRCLPCHECLTSHELVWTESLFNLVHNILNYNVHLTQDSVDQLVYWACEFAERFSRSLKFGNFVLCLITKCVPSLKPHKLILIEAVEHTNTLVTKSILSKLASL
ncbi:uncharacterized protein LOC119993086 [Tripterygium wilfordii]|uniref:uncharacterized protein LOC119993086 n=1 Tax=Tripterygium wilfordii TaxID=458696 RepID=UPI0018F81FB2|nr:uncharacterized protein LOC119993086 [Tripterygium wilfordii]